MDPSNDENESTENTDKLTEDEKEVESEDNITPDEAHRVGEFNELNKRLDDIFSTLDSLKSTLSVLVKSGNVTVDERDDSDSDEQYDDIPSVDDLDLTI